MIAQKPKGIGKCATSCIGKSCKYSSHCASHEYCCSLNGTYRLNCIGEVCLSDNDCAPKPVVVTAMEIKVLATGFVMENPVRMMLIALYGNIVVVLMPHALQNVLRKCAPVVISVHRVNSAVVMLLGVNANVLNHALVYRAHITVSAHQGKLLFEEKMRLELPREILFLL